METELIDQILQKFKPISLEEMDSVALMNRTDTKFIFQSAQLPDLLNLALGSYQVLEINDQRRFAYTTTYLDTLDYALFKHHIAGKLNRYKVRYRVYESTKVSYLEVKFKSNKNRTIKWRIKNALNSGTIDETGASFLNKHMDSQMLLKPVQINKFTRITLVNLKQKERLTIDYNLQFSDTNGKEISMPYLSIAEIKQEKSSQFSPFRNILKANLIRPSGFSKYCMGNALLKVLPEKNVFKSKLLILEKIKHDHILHAASR